MSVAGKIRFAVVGYGHIGKRHAAMIDQNPEAELVAVVDIDPACESDVLKNYQVPFYTSLEDFLEASDSINPDVVNIATPNHLHSSQSIEVLKSGFHVVCEKPFSLSTKDAKEVIKTSTEMEKLVFCVMQNRYSPPSVWLKEIVDSGRLGEIYMVQVNCFWNRDERYYTGKGWRGNKEQDGGTLFTQFSHFVDMLYWLFGDVKDIQARFNDFNHRELTDFEDSGTVLFNLVNGGAGSFNYSTSVWDKNLESSITIVAEKGTIKVGGQYMDRVDYCHIKDYPMPEMEASGPANDYGNYTGSAANHHFVIENVVNTIKGRTKQSTTALEGMKVVDIIERIYLSKGIDIKQQRGK